MLTVQELLQLYLDGAKLMSRSDSRIAEQLFTRALNLAMQNYGDNAGDVGLVLLDFSQFLESQGRIKEANEQKEHIRRVLARCFLTQPDTGDGGQ